jgi:hypothetical protein
MWKSGLALAVFFVGYGCSRIGADGSDCSLAGVFEASHRERVARQGAQEVPF